MTEASRQLFTTVDFQINEVAMASTTKQSKTPIKQRTAKHPNVKSDARKRSSMTGGPAAGFHEGSRSEILADYLFSAWGTVTPVRRQSDYGLDLYCTLTDTVGRRMRVREYFSVQVKSGDDAWTFNGPASVKWLVDHPLPLFLSTVNKKGGVVRVYHTIPRFQIWALGALPSRVVLTPGGGHNGQFDPCAGLPICSLSAPILEVTRGDYESPGRNNSERASGLENE
jgi:hypothetical protein